MKTLQRTFSIVKPDAVKKGATGDIIHTLTQKGFRIIGMKMLEITKDQAEGFYAVHAGKPFFNSLTDFMSSGPMVVMALEKENAIADLRELMGDRKSTRLNSSHTVISYAVFCLKKKKKNKYYHPDVTQVIYEY